MDTIIEDLKAHARRMHRAAQRGDPRALDAVRLAPELRGLDDATLASELKRRHCLAALARSLGFGGWPHLLRVLAGDDEDFGTLLYPKSGGAYWNIWSADYEEARAIRADHGGYLLGYRRQFVIVEDPFIEWIGLDPANADWARIERDWVRPADLEARTRLYATAITHALSSLDRVEATRH